MRKIIAVALLPVLFTGCAVGPKYVRPAVQPPASFYAKQQATANSAADMAWWDLFKDPVLQDLIREALKNNYDLQLAVARVEQERALLGVSRSQYYPQVGYGANISGQQSPTVPNHTYYSFSFSALWEIDLFGRIRKLNEAQRAASFSSEEARRDVRLLVMSDVAQGYFQLRALDEQLAIASRTVQSFQETLDLFQRKFQGGAASGLEVARAQAALPDVPAGLPAILLERRPDLRETEQDLIAANANVGVAKANFFPTISLTGLLGGVSPQLSELTASGKAWSLAGNLAGPIFTGGRLKNEYRVSLALRDQAKISFEKAVTRAFGEVSTSLSAHQQLARAYREQLKAVEAYRDSVRMSFIRYDSGLSSYFEIIDAQIQLYPAESSSVAYDLGRKLAMVDLYRTLGGGWNLSDSQWTSTSGVPGSTQTTAP